MRLREIDELHAGGTEYLVMKPLAPKHADVAAFISNCGAKSFRLQALQALSANLTVHSYGRCMRNIDTTESKPDVLQRYKFTLAFENSQVLNKSWPAASVPYHECCTFMCCMKDLKYTSLMCPP